MYHEKIKGMLEKNFVGNFSPTSDDQFGQKLSVSQGMTNQIENIKLNEMNSNLTNTRKFDHKIENSKNNFANKKIKYPSGNIDIEFGIFPSKLIKEMNDTENWKVKIEIFSTLKFNIIIS